MKLLLVIISLIFLLGQSYADRLTIVSRCISLADADTITVRAVDQNFKIRLVGIDSPENGQEYGSKAQRAGSIEPMAPWDFRAIGKKLAVIKEQREQYPDQTQGSLKYWLNTSSNSRNNEGCRHYSNMKRGRPCEAHEGKASGICGG